jgi:hypothetical protein
MDNKRILFLVNKAIEEVEIYILKYKDFANIEQKDTLRVLKFLKDDIEKKIYVQERILRGYKDICTVTAIHYEDSTYADSIFNLNSELEKVFPQMKSLELLGRDFGKGIPI